MMSRIWVVSFTKIADERRRFERRNDFNMKHTELPVGNPARDDWQAAEY